jgi:hypothetical protein
VAEHSRDQSAATRGGIAITTRQPSSS